MLRIYIYLLLWLSDIINIFPFSIILSLISLSFLRNEKFILNNLLLLFKIWCEVLAVKGWFWISFLLILSVSCVFEFKQSEFILFGQQQIDYNY